MTDAADIASKDARRAGGATPCTAPHQYYRVDNGGNVRIVVDGGYARPVKLPDDEVRAAGIEWIRVQQINKVLTNDDLAKIIAKAIDCARGDTNLMDDSLSALDELVRRAEKNA